MDNLKSLSQSRRDDTLLTVGFSLRYRRHPLSLSPARAILENVSSLRDLVVDEHYVRRLKPTVNKMLSLRDIHYSNKKIK